MERIEGRVSLVSSVLEARNFFGAVLSGDGENFSLNTWRTMAFRWNYSLDLREVVELRAANKAHFFFSGGLKDVEKRIEQMLTVIRFVKPRIESVIEMKCARRKNEGEWERVKAGIKNEVVFKSAKQGLFSRFRLVLYLCELSWLWRADRHTHLMQLIQEEGLAEALLKETEVKFHYNRLEFPEEFSDDGVLSQSVCSIGRSPILQPAKLEDCGHLFEEKQIRYWFHYNKFDVPTCPNCRKAIIDKSKIISLEGRARYQLEHLNRLIDAVPNEGLLSRIQNAFSGMLFDVVRVIC